MIRTELKIRFSLVVILALISSFVFSSQPGAPFITVKEDGAWCWFSDPRAVFYEGVHSRTYIGSASSSGDIQVGYYDHLTKAIELQVIYPELQVDDHINPSLLFLPDGRLMCFFTRHNGGFYYTRTLLPEDISKWEPVQILDMGSMLSYTNPVMLSEENNRIYVFLRGGYDWKPTYTYSDDLGNTWSQPQTIVGIPGASVLNRPYTKVVSDGKGHIWMAITDGHPRDEPLNSIYVFYYTKGAFYQMDGTVLAQMDELPFDQLLIDKAYDATSTMVRSWIWDLAVDASGHPRFTYARLKEETRHQYYYAEWDGVEWLHSLVSEAGQDFPREVRKKEERNPEPHYSGGIVLDPVQPGMVYYSRPVNDRFEIMKGEWNTKSMNWREIPVTKDSEQDNVRPYAVNAFGHSTLFWMSNIWYRHYTDYKSKIQLKVFSD